MVTITNDDALQYVKRKWNIEAKWDLQKTSVLQPILGYHLKPEGRIIHLAPNASPHTILHEAGHWHLYSLIAWMFAGVKRGEKFMFYAHFIPMIILAMFSLVLGVFWLVVAGIFWGIGIPMILVVVIYVEYVLSERYANWFAMKHLVKIYKEKSSDEV